MIALHRGIGIALALVFLAVALTGLVIWIRNREPGRFFWALLATGQTGLVIQIAFGGVMFFTRGGQHFLHYVYGGFPIVPLAFAHLLGRKNPALGWVLFSLAAFFIAGLQLRGLMTAT